MIYGYIYKIVNNINKKVYIGQTVRNPKERWKDHLKKLKEQRHHSKHLQHSYNKHGDVFSFHVLNYGTSKKALNELEIKYIAKYNSTNKKYGYNILIGGKGVRHTLEMKRHKSILLTKNNPMKRPEIAKKQSETAIRLGVNKGKNNGRYRQDIPDNSYLTFLYLDLLLTSRDISKIYDIHSASLIFRLKGNGTVLKSKSVQNMKGLCRTSRYNSMFLEIDDDYPNSPIPDYPGVTQCKKDKRWTIYFNVNKKPRKFGSFILKEDAIAECKKLRKKYNAPIKVDDGINR